MNNEIKANILDILTTIKTLSNYACEESGRWIPEENMNFPAEAFYHTIFCMAEEARGWLTKCGGGDG